MAHRFLFSLLALALVAGACSTSPEPGLVEQTTAVPAVASTVPPGDGSLRNQLDYLFPDPPPITITGPLAAEVAADFESLWSSLTTPDVDVDVDAIERLGQSGDPRVAWLMADLLRFIQTGDVQAALLDAATTVTSVDLSQDPVAARSPWQSLTDHLIAWDLPAHPEYQELKGRIFTVIEPGWQPFFDDAEALVDWRFTSWGGVRIDSRPLGDPNPCDRGCIPALDDPKVTSAADGSWYDDERLIFGVVVNGEARAYPKHHMEVHEMVNDTIGGRRVGIPYCTLCGSAQAYFTDSVPDSIEVPVLRTSGLLTRSNKVMYDLVTFSVFDTFTGEALSGPLREAGIALEQTTVITSTWGDWKAAHPDTTIVAEDGGLGRLYRLDPLGNRDANGPIFPVGDVDPRLPVQAQVVGVIAPDGTPVAFPVDDLRLALGETDTVELAGILIMADGGGFVATLGDGTPVASHQSFWFAWSQFHPETLLWSPATLGS